MRRLRWIAASMCIALMSVWLLSSTYSIGIQVGKIRLLSSAGSVSWRAGGWSEISITARPTARNWEWLRFKHDTKVWVAPGWLPLLIALLLSWPFFRRGGHTPRLRGFPLWWCVLALGVVALLWLLPQSCFAFWPLGKGAGLFSATLNHGTLGFAYLSSEWLTHWKMENFETQTPGYILDWFGQSNANYWVWLQVGPTPAPGIRCSVWTIVALLAWELTYRVTARLPRGRCDSCGYKLLADQTRCPECGVPRNHRDCSHA